MAWGEPCKFSRMWNCLSPLKKVEGNQPNYQEVIAAKNVKKDEKKVSDSIVFKESESRSKFIKSKIQKALLVKMISKK